MNLSHLKILDAVLAETLDGKIKWASEDLVSLEKEKEVAEKVLRLDLPPKNKKIYRRTLKRINKQIKNYSPKRGSQFSVRLSLNSWNTYRYILALSKQNGSFVANFYNWSYFSGEYELEKIEREAAFSDDDYPHLITLFSIITQSQLIPAKSQPTYDISLHDDE